MEQTRKYLEQFLTEEEVNSNLQETKNFLDQLPHMSEECGNTYDENYKCSDLFISTNKVLNSQSYLHKDNIPKFYRASKVQHYRDMAHSSMSFMANKLYSERTMTKRKLSWQVEDAVTDYVNKLQRLCTLKFLSRFPEINSRCKHLYHNNVWAKEHDLEHQCSNIYHITNNLLHPSEIPDKKHIESLQRSIGEILVNGSKADAYKTRFVDEIFHQ